MSGDVPARGNSLFTPFKLPPRMNGDVPLREVRDAVGLSIPVHHKCPTCGAPYYCYGANGDGCEQLKAFVFDEVIQVECKRCGEGKWGQN